MVCPWWGFLLSQEAELSWDPTGHPSSQARQSELVSAAIKLLGAQLHRPTPCCHQSQVACMLPENQDKGSQGDLSGSKSPAAC